MENPLATLPLRRFGPEPICTDQCEGEVDNSCKSCTSGQIGCCCGRRPARLCCTSLPVIPESLSTCMMYTLFLFVGFVLMNLMLVPSIQEGIADAFPSILNSTLCQVVLNNQCPHVYAVLVIYRICLSLSSFHFVLVILTFMVADSTSWRGGIHNGMWGLKIVAIFITFFITFLIPSYNVDRDGSQTIFVFILAAFFGALLFNLIQMVILIASIRAMCYKWMKKLSAKAESWVSFLIGAGSWCLLIAVGFGFKYMHEFYNNHEWCNGNLNIIIANGVICLLLVLVSTSKCVYQHTGGTKRAVVQENLYVVLLQTAALSAYVCGQTWSAIAGEYMYVAADGFVANKTGKDDEPVEIPQDKIVEQYCGPSFSLGISDNDVICYAGIIFAFATVMQETLSVSNSAYKIGLRPSKRDYLDCCCTSEAPAVDENGGQRVVRNEREAVTYSYSFFHFLFSLANTYIMIQLLEWQIFYTSHKEITEFYRVSIPFVVKMISIYAVVFVYFLTLVCTGKCCGFLNRTRQVVERDGRLDTI